MLNSAGSKPKVVAVIDADGFLFAVACSGESCAKGQGEDGEDMYFATLTDEEAYYKVVEMFDEIKDKVGADSALICLSDRKCFRYGILPSYKGNRKETRRPPLLAVLKEMISERKPFPVINVKGLEADDVCGITAGTLRAAGKDPIICSPDKDLRTIPGKLYACRPDSVVEEITEEMADRYHLLQTLMGDTTDGYTGCPKVGAVRANKVLDECDEGGYTPAKRWQAVLFQFTQRGFDEEYALTQARVARILRASDWDAEAKVPILWVPPTE